MATSRKNKIRIITVDICLAGNARADAVKIMHHKQKIIRPLVLAGLEVESNAFWNVWKLKYSKHSAIGSRMFERS